MDTSNYCPKRDLKRCLSEVTAVAPTLAAGVGGERWAKRLQFLVENLHPECHISADDGAFSYDRQRGVVSFNENGLTAVRAATMLFGDEVAADWSPEDRKRIGDAATNLYVIHELTHIIQNIPHFHLVPELKKGMGVAGLAHLDVAADFHAAWAAANIEWRLAGCPSDISISQYFTNMLMLAYVIGARGFPPAGRTHKIQRLLGVMTGAAFNQAADLGVLNRLIIHPDWTPRVPLMAFNLTEASSFNAFMTEPEVGVLIGEPLAHQDGNPPVAQRRLLQVWNAVGEKPAGEIMDMLFRILAQSQIVRLEMASAAQNRAR